MNCMTIVRAFFMRKISEYAFLWGLGGCLYYSFELIFPIFTTTVLADTFIISPTMPLDGI